MKEYRHIGKFGGEPRDNCYRVRGWVKDGFWQAILPYPTVENVLGLDAAISNALGTNNWGFEPPWESWGKLKAKAEAIAEQQRRLKNVQGLIGQLEALGFVRAGKNLLTQGAVAVNLGAIDPSLWNRYPPLRAQITLDGNPITDWVPIDSVIALLP